MKDLKGYWIVDLSECESLHEDSHYKTLREAESWFVDMFSGSDYPREALEAAAEDFCLVQLNENGEVLAALKWDQDISTLITCEKPFLVCTEADIEEEA